MLAATQGPEDAAGRSGNVEEVSLDDLDVLAVSMDLLSLGADVPRHHVEDFCDPQSGALNQILVYVKKKKEEEEEQQQQTVV